MSVEFNKRVVKDSCGNVISDTSDLKIEDGKLFGVAVDNFKKEIIKVINEEIIKPENEKIKQELEEIKTAILNKNEGLLKKALRRLINIGVDKSIEVIAKILLTQIGINIP